MCYPAETLRAFCRRFSGVVLVDEAYVDFSEGRNSLELAKSLPNVLVCRTLSKSFSLAGLRLGYAVGSVELIGALYKLKDSYNVDGLAQGIALAAMGDLPWMEGNARKIVATRKRVAAELEKRGFQVVPSAANFLFVEPPPGLSAAELFAGLRMKKILVRYFPGGRTGNHLRVSIGTDAQMDAFLAALPE